MTTRLVIECGVAATRAALLESGVVTQFWFGPARGDEREDQAPRVGRNFAGRVKSINKSLSAAFVDIGDGLDGFLSLTKRAQPHVTEGALIGVCVKSPPRQGKGAALKYTGEVDGEKIGRLPPIHDAAIEAVLAIGDGVEEIVVDEGAACAALKAHGFDATIIHEQHSVALFEVYEAESALELAFSSVVALAGGGRIVINEAQALTAIDVDTVGLDASSPARLREKIATSAALEAARQIRLRNIGGHVAIDFPSVSDKSSRARFRELLDEVIGGLDGAGAASFSKSGLYSFTMPHHAQSLLERFTDIAPSDPQPGRRFTLDWQAKSAIRAVEHRLRAAPMISISLRLGPALYDFMNMQPQWSERLADRYGKRYNYIEDVSLKERDFELTEQ